jgi:hypothetical protein
MRSYSWRGLLAASLGLFATGTNAQTGTTDLGTLLAGQKNLTTFNTLIQVCCASQWFRETQEHLLIHAAIEIP